MISDSILYNKIIGKICFKLSMLQIDAIPHIKYKLFLIP